VIEVSGLRRLVWHHDRGMGKKSKKQRQKRRKEQRKAHKDQPLVAIVPVESTTRQRAAPSVLIPPALAESDGFAEQLAHDEQRAQDEQRATARVSLSVEIHLTSDSHFFSGLSGDISEGGIFVSTYRPLALGDVVDLEFSIPGSPLPVRARGEVRWHRPHSSDQPRGVGIAFEALAEGDQKRIHDFCTVRPPLYYEDVG
jgi:uncharacterized protein (TIGR02266 family)